MTSTWAISFADIEAAARRIAPLVHRTPVATCAALDRLAGRRLFFKCEHLQKVGAFKFRGACNAIAALGEEAERGIVTHSSGNHAQAVALAARLRSVQAHVVMPHDSNPKKRAAVLDYGARVVSCELAEREAVALLVAEQTGAVLVPSYNHPDVIAGQGTAALELLQEVPDLDAIIAPIGGGGLFAGTAIAAAHLRPGIRIFGAEPLGADDAARSFAAGHWLPQSAPRTIADGLRTSTGTLTWPIIRDFAEAVVTVEEPEIVRAMRHAWERAKLLIEPSSAVAVAAVLGDAFRELEGIERVGIILSGGNVDLDALPW